MFSPDPVGKVSEFFGKIDRRPFGGASNAREDVAVAMWVPRPLGPPSHNYGVADSEAATAD